MLDKSAIVLNKTLTHPDSINNFTYLNNTINVNCY